MERRVVDYILDLKSQCRFEEEIGGACALTLAEVRCLGVLRPGETLSAGDLAGRLGLSPSRASRVITGVREKGLLVESLDVRDRRAVSLSLTPAGEGMLKRIEKKKNQCEQRLVRQFSGKQTQEVLRGLGILLEAMRGGTRGQE